MQLTGAVADTGAREVVFLGDFLHSARSHARRHAGRAGTLARARTPDLRLTLVRGNHDDRAGDPPGTLRHPGGRRAAAARPVRAVPPPAPGAGRLRAGRPLASLHQRRGRAFERLRLPCFWLGDDTASCRAGVGVLPAFGSFTGMHRIEPEAGRPDLPGGRRRACAPRCRPEPDQSRRADLRARAPRSRPRSGRRSRCRRAARFARAPRSGSPASSTPSLPARPGSAQPVHEGQRLLLEGRRGAQLGRVDQDGEHAVDHGARGVGRAGARCRCR